MSFSYDVSRLDDTPLYQLRLLLRDTTEATHQLEDEELDWLLTQHANLYQAAVAGVDLLLGRLEGGGGVASKRVGDLSLTYDRSYYTDMQARWRRLGLGHQTPSAGGLSRGEAAVLTGDRDWQRPAFTRDLHEDRGGGEGERD